MPQPHNPELDPTFALLSPPPAQPATPPQPAAALPRHDLYAAIHKAMRLALTDTLVAVGRLDVHEPAALARGLDALDGLLDLCESHLVHEDRFVHPAMEARAPGSSRAAAQEHGHHDEAITRLRQAAARLRRAPQAAEALQLYRLLSVFVGENLLHMHLEETEHNAVLWSRYADAELLQLQQALHASIPPAEMATVMRWMVPALSPAERDGLVAGLAAELPADALAALLQPLRRHLDESGWARLARCAGWAPVPGLVRV